MCSFEALFKPVEIDRFVEEMMTKELPRQDSSHSPSPMPVENGPFFIYQFFRHQGLDK